MSDGEQKYLETGASLKTERSQMFGVPCFKTGKKPFVSFHEEAMVFKLTGETHKEALDLEGASLFDPSKKNRPMKEWVKVPFKHHEHWAKLAQDSKSYVESLIKK